MSASLVWQLVGRNNSYLVKRNGVQLSTDPLNLTNVNRFTDAGFAKEKAIGVGIVHKKVKLLVKNSQRGPKTAVSKATLSKNIRKATKAIKGATAKNRRDLRPAALARVARILKAQRARK